MQLEISGLDQHYGSAQVLRDVSFTVADGACVAVLGRNGAGKTTLLKCIMGLLDPSAGTIRLDGADITAWPTHRRSRAGIAYVPQGREIFADLTVGDNLRAAARPHGSGTADIDEAVSLFPILREMWGRGGGQLSGGQQQQLAIARALVTRPRLLILDEPTEGIQPSIVTRIEEVITSFRGRMSIVLVEQYLDFALAAADHLVVLSRGSVVQTGDRGSMSRDKLAAYIVV
jgi:urea transport system ATP-binding protein